MSYWELKDYINRLQATGFQVKKYLVGSTPSCRSRW